MKFRSRYIWKLRQKRFVIYFWERMNKTKYDSILTWKKQRINVHGYLGLSYSPKNHSKKVSKRQYQNRARIEKFAQGGGATNTRGLLWNPSNLAGLVYWIAFFFIQTRVEGSRWFLCHIFRLAGTSLNTLTWWKASDTTSESCDERNFLTQGKHCVLCNYEVGTDRATVQPNL